MKTFNGVFYDFTSKIDEVLRLEESLQKAKQEVELFTKEILNEPKLHEALTAVGIVHDKKLYKKVAALHNQNRTHNSRAYYLDIQDYIEPVQLFELDKLGDNNE